MLPCLYKMPGRVNKFNTLWCCNPFKKHSSRVGNRRVNEAMRFKLPSLVVGHKICDTCRTRVYRLPLSAEMCPAILVGSSGNGNKKSILGYSHDETDDFTEMKYDIAEMQFQDSGSESSSVPFHPYSDPLSDIKAEEFKCDIEEMQFQLEDESGSDSSSASIRVKTEPHSGDESARTNSGRGELIIPDPLATQALIANGLIKKEPQLSSSSDEETTPSAFCTENIKVEPSIQVKEESTAD